MVREEMKSVDVGLAISFPSSHRWRSPAPDYAPAMPLSPLRLCDAVGAAILGWLGWILDVATLCGHATGHLLRPASLPPVARTVLRRQILFTGVEAVPFTALLALLTAVMVVVQAQVALAGFGQSDLFGQLLVAILVR